MPKENNEKILQPWEIHSKKKIIKMDPTKLIGVLEKNNPFGKPVMVFSTGSSLPEQENAAKILEKIANQ